MKTIIRLLILAVTAAFLHSGKNAEGVVADDCAVASITSYAGNSVGEQDFCFTIPSGISFAARVEARISCSTSVSFRRPVSPVAASAVVMRPILSFMRAFYANPSGLGLYPNRIYVFENLRL